MKHRLLIALAFALLMGPVQAAQNSVVLPTTGPMNLSTFVSGYLNPAFQSLMTCHSGATPPANGVGNAAQGNQCWWDTSGAPNWVLKYYDGAQWASLATLNTSAHSFSIATSEIPSTKSGTSYSMADADKGQLIIFSNAGAVAVSIAQAGSGGNFASGWYADLKYTGSATATITPTTSTADGQSTLSLKPGQGVRLVSDGSNYITTTLSQPFNSNLYGLAGLTTAADKCEYWTGAGTPALFDCKSWIRSVIGAADASAGRLAFGLAIGTDIQAHHANLDALAGLTGASGKVAYFTGPGALLMFDTTSFGRSISNVADAAALRTLAGVVIGTNVQAWDADLDCIAALSTNGIVARTGSGTCAVRTMTAPAAGITFSNGDGVSGNPTVALANDLAALEGLSGTGIARRTGTDAWSLGSAVTNAELDTMATARFKGRTTAGTGAVEDLTATQATAILNNCVGDSGSGGTKGLVPAPGAGDAAGGKYLKADCTWGTPAGGGGGGGGMTDSERQNAALNTIYLSKVLADPRRLVNMWATGFKAGTDAARGIDAGSSSNYDTSSASASGYIAPSSSLSYTNVASVSGTTSFGPNYTYVNRNTAIPNSTQICYLGISLASAETVTMKIVQRDSSTQYDVLVSISFAHPGGGYSDVAIPGCYTTAGSGTHYAAVWFNTSASRTSTASVSRSYYNGDPAVQNNLTGWTDDTSGGPALRWAGAGSPNNMTLVTTAQTADSSVSNGRCLIEYDPLVSITLNTDLTCEVTFNGGSSWASASLSAVTSYSGGSAQRRVAESVDQAGTSGTSFATRVKTLNNKSINLYGIHSTVR